jgi:hypothetical protein
MFVVVLKDSSFRDRRHHITVHSDAKVIRNSCVQEVGKSIIAYAGGGGRVGNSIHIMSLE